MSKIGFIGKDVAIEKVISSIVKGTIGSNVLTNPGFETWTETMPDGWTLGVVGEAGATYAKETTIVHTGNNAVKLTPGGSSSHSFAYQAFTTTTGKYYTIGFWTRHSTGESASANLVMLNGTLITATHMYDPATEAWVAVDFENLTSYQPAITNAYDQYFQYDIPAPANNTLGVVLSTADTGDYYFDDISLQEQPDRVTLSDDVS